MPDPKYTSGPLVFADETGTSIVKRFGGILQIIESPVLSPGYAGGPAVFADETGVSVLKRFGGSLKLIERTAVVAYTAGPVVFADETGVSILKRFGGMLQVSNDGGVTWSQFISSDISWTRTPDLWFSGNDVNLLSNAGIADLDPIGTWKNKGALGAAWDMVQATAGNKPLFKLISAAGKMNNKPALRFDGIDDYIASAVNGIQAQPATWVIVGKSTGAGTQVWFSGSSSNRNQIYTGVLVINLYAGGVAPTGANIVANTYHTMSGLFTGVSSTGALDGSVSGAVNPGVAGFDQVAVGAGPPYPTAPAAIDVLQLAAFIGGSQPTHAQLVASVTAQYGATPQ